MYKMSPDLIFTKVLSTTRNFNKSFDADHCIVIEINISLTFKNEDSISLYQQLSSQ